MDSSWPAFPYGCLKPVLTHRALHHMQVERELAAVCRHVAMRVVQRRSGQAASEGQPPPHGGQALAPPLASSALPRLPPPAGPPGPSLGHPASHTVVTDPSPDPYPNPDPPSAASASSAEGPTPPSALSSVTVEAAEGEGLSLVESRPSSSCDRVVVTEEVRDNIGAEGSWVRVGCQGVPVSKGWDQSMPSNPDHNSNPTWSSPPGKTAHSVMWALDAAYWWLCNLSGAVGGAGSGQVRERDRHTTQCAGRLDGTGLEGRRSSTLSSTLDLSSTTRTGSLQPEVALLQESNPNSNPNPDDSFSRRRVVSCCSSSARPWRVARGP